MSAGFPLKNATNSCVAKYSSGVDANRNMGLQVMESSLLVRLTRATIQRQSFWYPECLTESAKREKEKRS